MLTKIAAYIRYQAVRRKKGVTLPVTSFIGHRCRIRIHASGSITAAGKIRMDDCSEMEAIGHIRIGKGLVLNGFSRIIAHQRITIGEHVVIAKFVSILDHDHAYTFKEGRLTLNGYNSAAINIGNNVWIGDKVSINKGVSIGNNVVIGANSVVTRNIPSNCIAAGVPARIIKELNPSSYEGV